jgi:dCTP deaminase
LVKLYSDVDITAAINSGDITITPYNNESLTPVGYDLCIGTYGFSLNKNKEFNIENDGHIKIDPNDTVVIETLESVSLTKKIGGTIHSIVSITITYNLSHISTTVDPGWEGKLLIHIHNLGKKPVTLSFKQRLCTICFYPMTNEASKSHTSPPGRVDIRNWLSKIDNKKTYPDRKFWLIACAVIVIAICSLLQIYKKELVAPAAAILTAASLFIVEIFKPK